MGNSNDCVTVTRQARQKGVNLYIDQVTWERTLENANIPIDTPLSKIRVKRYYTKYDIILRVKRIKTPDKIRG